MAWAVLTFVIVGLAVTVWAVFVGRATIPVNWVNVLDDLHSELKAERLVREARRELAERPKSGSDAP